MTMPVALAPSAAPAVNATGGGSGVAGASAGAEGFGALVAAALALTPEAAALLPSAVAAVRVLPSDAQEGLSEASDAPGGQAGESEAELAGGDLAAQLLGVVVPVALLTPVSPLEAAPVDGAAAAPVAAPLDALPVVTPSDLEPSLPHPAAPGSAESQTSAPPALEPEPARATAEAAATLPAATAGATTGAVTEAPPTAQHAVAPLEGLRLPQTTSSDAPTATGPVARQTFPEVTRLVTRGDGTHRLTIQLRPEGLGDVRVVLTMRDGKVDVRLTASAGARDALASDLPELHRLLAAAGATETSVSIRDTQQLLSSSVDGPRSAAPSSSGDLMGQAGGGTGQSRQREENPQQARMTADQIATDGVRDRAKASGPNDPATGARAAGLDVTV